MKIKTNLKRVIAIASVAAMTLSFAACKKEQPTAATAPATTAATTVPTTTKPATVMNPLTGEQMSSSLENKRPVGIMINNIKVAQGVQTGVGDADMVFETLVEGGITRLLAVYSDISKMGQIGTVRSSRYSYAALACGLDARYIHCGSDNKYCTPYMRELGMDDLDLMSNASSAAKRVQNGKAYEHTLYTFGDKINTLYKKGRTDIKDYAKNVYTFNDPKSPKKYETPLTSAKVVFSDGYSTGFEYEEKSGKYIRKSGGEALVDYKTDKKERFTNVLVLFDSVHTLSDGHHMISELESGKGVYITGGTVTDISWKKGGAKKPLKFYNADGSDLTLNAGNSYICITDKSNKSSCKIG